MQVSVDGIPAAGRRALTVLAELAGPERPVWLVGGALRELVGGGAAGDLDLAVAGGALDLGRRLADRLGAAFVVLDAARGAGRVVGRSGGPALDLVDLRAPALDGDLRARDFTVNALAAPIGELLGVGRAEVLDPTGGLDDLARGLVRVCAPTAIADDPVRALRGVRLAMRPGWRLTPETETAIAAGAPRVAGVSAERVRDELVGILGEPTAAAGLRALDRLGVLPVLLPESLAMRATAQPLPHHFDVWEHSLRTVEGVDHLLADLDALAPWGAPLREHLEEALGGRLTRMVILKLGALLHDVSKPETRALDGDRVRFIGHDAVGAGRARAIAERLRLPRRAASVLERLVAEHLRPMHLAQAGVISRRARFRFFRDLGDEARDVLLLSIADAAALTGASPLAVWAGAGGEVARTLLAGAEAETAAAATPALLRGEDVMEAFGLRPGPEVGRLLARAREAQAMGVVATREEAIEYLRRSGT
ncbi:MAG TPA: HDIG domain-containing protein [Methylomirabilota bacterium]|nr:HDIG domain-containing protein [Methylomirabilota bacterium]